MRGEITDVRRQEREKRREPRRRGRGSALKVASLELLEGRARGQGRLSNRCD
jgi:hypothetical protein